MTAMARWSSPAKTESITPSDESVRFYTGNGFDIVGERRRTSYGSNSSEQWGDASFEIKVAQEVERIFIGS